MRVVASPFYLQHKGAFLDPHRVVKVRTQPSRFVSWTALRVTCSAGTGQYNIAFMACHAAGLALSYPPPSLVFFHRILRARTATTCILTSSKHAATCARYSENTRVGTVADEEPVETWAGNDLDEETGDGQQESEGKDRGCSRNTHAISNHTRRAHAFPSNPTLNIQVYISPFPLTTLLDQRGIHLARRQRGAPSTRRLSSPTR